MTPSYLGILDLRKVAEPSMVTYYFDGAMKIF